MQYKCPKCGNSIEEGVNPCPTCGQQFNWPKPVAPIAPIAEPDIVTNNATNNSDADEVSKGTKVLNLISLLLWILGILNSYRCANSSIEDQINDLNSYGYVPTDYLENANNFLEALSDAKSKIIFLILMVVIIFALNIFVIYFSKQSVKTKKLISIAALVVSIMPLIIIAGDMAFQVFALSWVPFLLTVITELLLVVGFGKIKE